ncbi:MAG: hypothetical protein QOK80_10680, partial [Nitrososphaeraceae archaeon]|nr:hypothetical protein [Nitrososphaeraceae archaeon]
MQSKSWKTLHVLAVGQLPSIKPHLVLLNFPLLGSHFLAHIFCQSVDPIRKVLGHERPGHVCGLGIGTSP